MSNEPKNKQRSPARFTSNPEIYESDQGALMVRISYELIGDEFAAIQGICIGQKDGTMQESAINNLMDVFKLESIMGIASIEPSADGSAQFDWADWKPASDTNKYSGWKWLNEHREPKPIEALLPKWGDKLDLFKRQADAPAGDAVPAESKPAEAQPLKRRGRPTSVKPARQSSEREVQALLHAKYKVSESDSAGSEKLGNDYYFPALDELFGADNDPKSPEDYGKLADKLGL